MRPIQIAPRVAGLRILSGQVVVWGGKTQTEFLLSAPLIIRIGSQAPHSRLLVLTSETESSESED